MNSTVSISSAFLDLAFVRFAETVSIFTASDAVVLAHLMASAFDLLTSERLSVAKLINVAVRVVSALFLDAGVLVASVGIVVFGLADGVGVAIDALAEVVLAERVASTIFVSSALDWYATVLGADVGLVLGTKVLAVSMADAINILALVAVIFAAANLLVTAVFSNSALNINTDILFANFLGTTVIVRSTVDSLANIGLASLF